MDMASLVKPEFIPENGDLWPAINAIDGAREILCNANRTPDESVKADLIRAVRTTLENVVNALADPVDEPDDEED